MLSLALKDLTSFLWFDLFIFRFVRADPICSMVDLWEFSSLLRFLFAEHISLWETEICFGVFTDLFLTGLFSWENLFVAVAARERTELVLCRSTEMEDLDDGSSHLVRISARQVLTIVSKLWIPSSLQKILTRSFSTYGALMFWDWSGWEDKDWQRLKDVIWM